MPKKFLAMASLALLVSSGCAARMKHFSVGSYAMPALELFDPYVAAQKCEISGPDGKRMPVADFYLQSISGEKAKEYVLGKLDYLRSAYKAEWSPFDLAVRAVDIVLADLDIVHGNGYYTTKHEKSFVVGQVDIGPSWNMKKVNIQSFPDSTQTLDMFLSHKSGEYEGDCEDFAAALITSYEIMKSLAAENSKDEFYSKLEKGLNEYRIMGIDIEGENIGHAMNASVAYSNDFSIAYLRAIEPQGYSMLPGKISVVKDSITFDKGGYYLVRHYSNGEEKKKKIRRFYTASECYAPEATASHR